MALQFKLTNRRQFLGRSALGAGSLLFGPLLLESCTDHIIPDPGPGGPIITPPLGGVEDTIDWQDDAKKWISFGISEAVPEGGGILNNLLDVFWPSSGADVWGQVKQQVEDLVNKTIGDFEYEQVAEDLKGLERLITSYTNSLNNGTNEEKLIYWINVSNAFAEAQPHFQAPLYEVPLVGLFTQFANMYLSVLRDVVISGQSWGRTPLDHDQDKTNLASAIKEFTTYVNRVIGESRDALAGTVSPISSRMEPFKTLNAFDRNIINLVYDFSDYWQYFDVTQYPNGSTALSTREMFYDPFGFYTPSDPIFATPASPASRPNTMIVKSLNYIDAITINYPDGSTIQSGHTDYRGNDHTLPPLYDTPIADVTVSYGKAAISQVLFHYAGGGDSAGYGSLHNGDTTEGPFGYNLRVLSSIYVGGTPDVDYDDSFAVTFIVFGFQYWQSRASVSALAAYYIRCPKERSATELAKAFPKLGLSAASISKELKEARKAYWEKRHKGPK